VKQFYLITYSEQLFFFRKSNSSYEPVISLNLSEDTLGRIIPYFKRKDISFSLFWNSKFSTPNSISQIINDATILFLNEDSFVQYFRENLKYKGKIALFVNTLQLKNVNFFKKYNVIPIVSTSNLVDFCKKHNLENIFFNTTKRCIASNGTCISKNGNVQTFLNCDSRCREKSNSISKIDFPFSLKPIKTIPKNSQNILFYSEELNPITDPKISYHSEFLEKNWNYHFSIGKKIIKAGKSISIKRFFFKTNLDIAKAVKEGITFFWGYSGNIYKGRKITPEKLHWKEENRHFFVTIKETVDKLLLVQKFDLSQINQIKTAKHFLATLPQQKVIERKRIEINKEISFVKKIKLTVITDELSKPLVFKSGFVKRVVFNGNLERIPKDFKGYALVLDINSIKIEVLQQLKGIVVTNFTTYDYFKNHDKFTGEILFHPLYLSKNRNKPWFLTNRLAIFISDFISEKNVNYIWKKEFIKMENKDSFSLFYKEKKFLVRGTIPELWVDISKTDSKTALFLKKQSEQIIFSIKNK